MTRDPHTVISRDAAVFTITPDLLERVAAQFHFRECSVYDGRRCVDSCRGHDRDLAHAHAALVDVVRALQPGQALRWDGRVITSNRPRTP